MIIYPEIYKNFSVIVPVVQGNTFVFRVGNFDVYKGFNYSVQVRDVATASTVNGKKNYLSGNLRVSVSGIIGINDNKVEIKIPLPATNENTPWFELNKKYALAVEFVDPVNTDNFETIQILLQVTSQAVDSSLGNLDLTWATSTLTMSNGLITIDNRVIDESFLIDGTTNKIKNELLPDNIATDEDLSTKVSKTGNETIADVKTFTGRIVLTPTGTQAIAITPATNGFGAYILCYANTYGILSYAQENISNALYTEVAPYVTTHAIGFRHELRARAKGSLPNIPLGLDLAQYGSGTLLRIIAHADSFDPRAEGNFFLSCADETVIDVKNQGAINGTFAKYANEVAHTGIRYYYVDSNGASASGTLKLIEVGTGNTSTALKIIQSGTGLAYVVNNGTTDTVSITKGGQITATSFVGDGSGLTGLPLAPVQSVAGKTGVVTLVKGDVGLGNVDDTSDLAKPISTATQTALDNKQATITGGVSTVVTSNFLTNRALMSNGSGKASSSTVTSTELGHLTGVTSGIQSQIDTKQNIFNGTANAQLATVITRAENTTNGFVLPMGIKEFVNNSYNSLPALPIVWLNPLLINRSAPLARPINIGTDINNMTFSSTGDTTSFVANQVVVDTPVSYGVSYSATAGSQQSILTNVTIPASYTIIGFVRPSTTVEKSIFGGMANSTFGISLIDSGGTNLVRFVNNGVMAVATTTAPDVVANDAWASVAFTYNNSTGAYVIYINGTSRLTGTYSTTWATSTLSIARRVNSFYNGRYGDILMFNSVLTPAQLLTTHNLFKSTYGIV